jgi:hypothetical protein
MISVLNENYHEVYVNFLSLFSVHPFDVFYVFVDAR